MFWCLVSLFITQPQAGALKKPRIHGAPATQRRTWAHELRSKEHASFLPCKYSIWSFNQLLTAYQCNLQKPFMFQHTCLSIYIIYILFHWPCGFLFAGFSLTKPGKWQQLDCGVPVWRALVRVSSVANVPHFSRGVSPFATQASGHFLAFFAFRSCWYNTLFANYVNSRFRVTKTKTPQPMLHEDDLFFIARTSWSHYPIKNCLKVSTGNIWTQLHKVQVWTNDRLQMDFPLQLEYYRPKKPDRNKNAAFSKCKNLLALLNTATLGPNDLGSQASCTMQSATSWSCSRILSYLEMPRSKVISQNMTHQGCPFAN